MPSKLIRTISVAAVITFAASTALTVNDTKADGWASSPANAWLNAKPIPEKYRVQLKPTAPDSADEHPQGTFLALNTPAGFARLKRSAHKEDYWVLSTTFSTQVTQTLCSVATAITILNALPLSRPMDQVYKPYPYFTQANYFNDGVARLRSYQHTLTDGMTLQMAASAMRVHGAKTTAVHAADTTLEEFRKTVRDNLAREGDFVAINYQRKMIGQPKGAHFSPLGAYDKKTDSFLILDVARYKFPPVWVRADDLFKSMNTFDSELPKTRGFILVSAS